MTFDFFEGPAGSGKTFNMVAHARHLVENDALGEGQRMLALTYMNGARRRLTATLDAEVTFRRRFDCLTFDSFAQTIVARRCSKVTGAMQRKVEATLQEAKEFTTFDETCVLAIELLQDAEVSYARIWVMAEI